MTFYLTTVQKHIIWSFTLDIYRSFYGCKLLFHIQYFNTTALQNYLIGLLNYLRLDFGTWLKLLTFQKAECAATERVLNAHDKQVKPQSKHCFQL